MFLFPLNYFWSASERDHFFAELLVVMSLLAPSGLVVWPTQFSAGTLAAVEELAKRIASTSAAAE